MPNNYFSRFATHISRPFFFFLDVYATSFPGRFPAISLMNFAWESLCDYRPFPARAANFTRCLQVPWRRRGASGLWCRQPRAASCEMPGPPLSPLSPPVPPVSPLSPPAAPGRIQRRRRGCSAPRPALQRAHFSSVSAGFSGSFRTAGEGRRLALEPHLPPRRLPLPAAQGPLGLHTEAPSLAGGG